MHIDALQRLSVMLSGPQYLCQPYEYPYAEPLNGDTKPYQCTCNFNDQAHSLWKLVLIKDAPELPHLHDIFIVNHLNHFQELCLHNWCIWESNHWTVYTWNSSELGLIDKTHVPLTSCGHGIWIQVNHRKDWTKWHGAHCLWHISRAHPRWWPRADTTFPAVSPTTTQGSQSSKTGQSPRIHRGRYALLGGCFPVDLCLVVYHIHILNDIQAVDDKDINVFMAEWHAKDILCTSISRAHDCWLRCLIWTQSTDNGQHTSVLETTTEVQMATNMTLK